MARFRWTPRVESGKSNYPLTLPRPGRRNRAGGEAHRTPFGHHPSWCPVLGRLGPYFSSLMG